MNKKLIVPFDYLINNHLVYVKVSDSFRERLKEEILNHYNSLRYYGIHKLGVSDSTLSHQFRKQKYFNFRRILDIANDFNVPKCELFKEIKVAFAKGSNTCKELILPQELIINEFFVEGYALYLAEGDNGANGKTIPRKVRFANSELTVHKLFINWLNTYFPNNYFYFNVLVPYPKILTEEHRSHIIKYLDLDEDQIRVRTCRWKRKTGFVYKTCLDSALLIDLILSIKNKIKDLCSENKNLAIAYIKGMMIGEGTAYFNKNRYVRIEMKNEKEIKYLHNLFTLLGYSCKPYLRTNRQDMWSLYIGAKQLRKYYEEIGFGVHEKRQKILKKAVNKVLRVNQYC